MSSSSSTILPFLLVQRLIDISATCVFVAMEIIGPEASGLLPLQHRPGRQGPRLRLLGPHVACLALLPARGGPLARALAWQPAGPPVRGPPVQGKSIRLSVQGHTGLLSTQPENTPAVDRCGQDGHQAAH
eukprot:scaffold311616_cov30-Prasinocladus_malaysianus.AAC.1